VVMPLIWFVTTRERGAGRALRALDEDEPLRRSVDVRPRIHVLDELGATSLRDVEDDDAADPLERDERVRTASDLTRFSSSPLALKFSGTRAAVICSNASPETKTSLSRSDQMEKDRAPNAYSSSNLPSPSASPRVLGTVRRSTAFKS
jgi:hypothetical protein